MKIGLHLYDFIRLKICPLYKIKELIDMRKNILEIGCGKGTFYRKFLINEHNINYTGTDTNIKAIDLLKKYNQNKIKFIYEDIENTIKRVSAFDCILLIDVLHHIEKNRQKQIIELLIENMKPNTLLIYKDISNNNSIKGFINILHDLLFSQQIISYYDMGKIKKFVNLNKFLKIDEYFILKKYWYDHEFLVIRKHT